MKSLESLPSIGSIVDIRELKKYEDLYFLVEDVEYKDWNNDGIVFGRGKLIRAATSRDKEFQLLLLSGRNLTQIFDNSPRGGMVSW